MIQPAAENFRIFNPTVFSHLSTCVDRCLPGQRFIILELKEFILDTV